ncbi:MAG: Transcriptional regulator, AraC family protein, partial [Labilithrix sp.]|nr:Transcriptional regulator, AraC family protein [Labilithrix sp.]
MKASTELDYRARIDEALLWLAEHQTEEVTPAQLARVVAFSPYHFHRVFRGVSGESVMQCLRRLRLETAALRLRRTDDGVTEVALDVGFKSHEGFTRAFKEHFGAPPQVWRKQENARIQRLVQRDAMKIPEAEVRRSDPRRFVCLFHQGSFDDVPNVWGRFLTSASRQGVFTGREQLVGRYPDDPDITPPGKIRFDVGLLPRMEPRARLEEGLRDEVLPGGLWAVTVHRGSYATLSETYLRLVGGWFPHTGRALADRPCLELYLNSPQDTREEDLLTEVWAPIEG